ncbi:MAG: malonyl-CoA synthase [Gammaproteobacteria bacterium]
MARTSNRNLYERFARCFPSDPNAPVIETEDGRRWSYDVLHRETARLAGLFHALGLRKGERVAVQVEKSPEALLVYLACLRAGLIYLPLNTAYRPQEVDFFLGDAQPSLVIGRPEASRELQSLVRRHSIPHLLDLGAHGTGNLLAQCSGRPAEYPSVPCSGEDIAALLYTSGTTGRPKGAMLSHDNLASNALTLVRAWGFTATDVLLHALPLFHAHGLFVASHCVLLSGSKMVFLPKFEASSVVRYLPHTTVFMGVPTYYTRLLAEAAFERQTCAAMRLFISGSAPLREQTFMAFYERAGHRILERYGLTETLMNSSNPLHGQRRAGTVGQALDGVTIRITAETGQPLGCGKVGEIQVKGPNVFSGYWQRAERSREEFTDDGWFRTGDLGKLDPEGYLTIVGRRKDLIITGGYNVYPKEIERHIDRLPGVHESAVIGLPDPDFGEQVAAVVVQSSATHPLTADTLINALKQSLANYKVPKTVFFVDELPRNTMGKVQKNILRERFGQHQ